MDYNALSKEVSYILRHAPQKYGLSLDIQGWVRVDELISSLKNQEKFKSLTISDVETMIQFSEKKRHEIANGKIRALYGHSIKEKIVMKNMKPPDVLYHGTTHRFMESIFTVGLVSKNRQYVHLSKDITTAITVGKRRDENPAILKIDSKQAWIEGIEFFFGDESIWLAEAIPAKYICML